MSGANRSALRIRPGLKPINVAYRRPSEPGRRPAPGKGAGSPRRPLAAGFSPARQRVMKAHASFKKPGRVAGDFGGDHMESDVAATRETILAVIAARLRQARILTLSSFADRRHYKAR